MNYLFFDTETSGLPDWHKPSDSPHQPHLVQMSAILMTDAAEEIEVMDFIIKPDGWAWTMDDEAAKAHGITPDYADEHGVPEKWAAEQFREFHERAGMRVAHNEPFDARMMRIAFKRYGMLEWADDVFKGAPRQCTARMSTKLCNLPPSEKMMAAGRKTPKQPTLMEAHETLLGEKFADAHDGLADTRACARVFFECVARGVTP